MGTNNGTIRLSRLKVMFQLSDFQLAHLMGTDRNSLRNWRRAKIPKARIADFETLERLAATLGAPLARTIMHWPHPKLDYKSPLIAVQTLGLFELCARLAQH